MYTIKMASWIAYLYMEEITYGLPQIIGVFTTKKQAIVQILKFMKIGYQLSMEDASGSKLDEWDYIKEGTKQQLWENNRCMDVFCDRRTFAIQQRTVDKVSKYIEVD